MGCNEGTYRNVKSLIQVSKYTSILVHSYTCLLVLSVYVMCSSPPKSVSPPAVQARRQGEQRELEHPPPL